MKFLSRNPIDATRGNMLANIIKYAFPLFLSTLVQTCFNMVDIAVLGNMADSNAVASVGATTTIVFLIVHSFVGISNGAKIILSRLFGAKDSEALRRTSNTVVITALGLGFFIALIGIPLAPWLLEVTKCPEECIEGAVLYIQIYLIVAPAIMIYNFGSAIITSSGDSQRPLVYIIVGGITNVVLNIILCLILPQKVIAVAVATAASQVISAAFVLHRISTMDGDGRVDLRHLKFYPREFVRIIVQGIPIAITNALYPLANLQIQSAINIHGVSAIAGNSASSQIEGLAGSISGPFAATTLVFMGQNIGAKKPERIKQAFWKCLSINVLLCAVIGGLVYMTGEFWLSLFLPDDPEAIEFGMIRLFFVILFYFISAANGVLSHAIQAYGQATYSAVNSMCCVFGFRIIWMWLVYPHFENTELSFHMLMACFLISWTLLLIFNIIGFIIFKKRFEKRGFVN